MHAAKDKKIPKITFVANMLFCFREWPALVEVLR